MNMGKIKSHDDVIINPQVSKQGLSENAESKTNSGDT